MGIGTQKKIESLSLESTLQVLRVCKEKVRKKGALPGKQSYSHLFQQHYLLYCTDEDHNETLSCCRLLPNHLQSRLAIMQSQCRSHFPEQIHNFQTCPH